MLLAAHAPWPVQLPRVHWQLALQVSVSVPQLPQVSERVAPGAHVPLTLLDGERSGLFLPSGAVLYGQEGPYVYKQLAAKPAEKATRYVPVKVTLLVPYGDGWLVKGVDDDDDIVVQGAGVLWSLQAMGSHPADADADDD